MLSVCYSDLDVRCDLGASGTNNLQYLNEQKGVVKIYIYI